MARSWILPTIKEVWTGTLHIPYKSILRRVFFIHSMKGLPMLTIILLVMSSYATEERLQTEYEIQRDLAAKHWVHIPKGDHWIYVKGIQAYCSMNYGGDNTPKGQVKFFVSCIHDTESDCKAMDSENLGCKSNKEAWELIRK
jgi:hypothetical protein